MRKRATRPAGRRRRFTPDDRRRLVSAWRRSGLSQCQFGREHGIAASYLSRWKVEFPEDEPEAPTLVPVQVLGSNPGSPATSGGMFEVRLPSGIEVAVPARFDESALRRLLGLLGTPSC